MSLTLNKVGDDGPGGLTADVMLVPHTLGRTLLGGLTPGAHVNIEVDVLARYVARQLEWKGRGEVDNADHDERLLGKLRSGGWV